MANGKQPAFWFFTGDWLSDPRLRSCSPMTRGVWVDILCWMHRDGGRGVIQRSFPAMKKLLGLSDEQLIQVLEELHENEVGIIALNLVDNLEEFVDKVVDNLCTKTMSRKYTPIFCDTSQLGSSEVTIINRRMVRDEKVRRQARIRKRKQRGRI